MNSFMKRDESLTGQPKPSHRLRLIFAAGLLFTVMACGRTEPEVRGFTIGIVNPNKGTRDMNTGFIMGLADQGYEAGKNVTLITSTDAAEQDSKLQQMVSRDADLIFVVTTPAAKKAIRLAKTRDIPVVFALFDPVKSGILKSLTTVQKNITGIQVRGSVPKALDWLLALSPEIKTILVPVHFDTPAADLSLGDLRKAAQARDINLAVREIGTVQDIAGLFQNPSEKIDAVFLIHSIFVSSHTDEIVREAGRLRIPVGGSISTYHRGALITFGVNHLKVGRQASRLAGQVLQGVETENIPVETAEFYLGINLETARDSGISVSNSILSYADDIIPLKKNGD